MKIGKKNKKTIDEHEIYNHGNENKKVKPM